MVIKINVKPSYPNQLVTFIGLQQNIGLEIWLGGIYFYSAIYLDNNLIMSGVPIVANQLLNIYPTKMIGYIYNICDNPNVPITIDSIGNILNFYFSDIKP